MLKLHIIIIVELIVYFFTLTQGHCGGLCITGRGQEGGSWDWRGREVLNVSFMLQCMWAHQHVHGHSKILESQSLHPSV